MKAPFFFSFLLIYTILLLTCPTQALAQTLTPESSISATPAITPTLPPAPEGMQLTLNPSILNLKTKPGEPITFQIRIRNGGTGPEALKTNLVKLEPTLTTDRPIPTEFSPNDPVPSWIQLSPSNFVIEPGQWQTIEGTFNPPPEAQLGYYLGVMFRRQQDSTVAEGTAALSGAPFVPMLVEVESGNAFQQLQLLEFSAPKWVEYLPEHFTIKVINGGNIHLQPFGNIFIDQGKKKDVGILTVNESAGFVLPGSRRTFEASWTDGFPVYQINEDGSQGELQWDFSQANKFRVGKYTATLLLAYFDGERDVPIEATLSFWVIPWKLLLIITGVGLILVIGIIAIIKTVFGGFKRGKPADDRLQMNDER